MDGEDKEKDKEGAWEMTLALWKKLSEMPDQELPLGVIFNFKNKILVELGYPSQWNGCPFCQQHSATVPCPLGDCSGKGAPPCYSTPYKSWELIAYSGRHSKELAKGFYVFLLNLRGSMLNLRGSIKVK